MTDQTDTLSGALARIGIASTPHADAAGLQDLRELIEWCHANGTPTVFWYTAPIGSVEPSGSAKRMRPGPRNVFGTVSASTTRVKDLRGSFANHSAACNRTASRLALPRSDRPPQSAYLIRPGIGHHPVVIVEDTPTRP